MTRQSIQYLNFRNTRLFGPMVLMMLGVVTLLVLLAGYLLQRFDISTSEREQHMVQSEFRENVAELKKVIATQVNWDDAILNLDNRFNPKWADFNVGNYLHTYNAFSHVFVIDGEAMPIYAAVKGNRSETAAYLQFKAKAEQLLPTIRRMERERPKLQRRPGDPSTNNMVVAPIQASSVEKVDGAVYILTATLVQPDFGTFLPKGPRAPVVIAARPIDASLLAEFSDRYHLEGLDIASGGPSASGLSALPLKGANGSQVAALVWEPHEPGTMLLNQLALPLVVSLVLLGLVCALIVRRSAAVVTDLVASEARAKHLAYHDVLTQLPNRARLFDWLRKHLARLDGSSRTIAVLCVDLDRFKEVNDTLGHHAGDILIETVAKRLRAICGHADLIARLGGDEFVLLCKDLDRAGVQDLAQAILEGVRQPVRSDFGRIEVGCSIGYAIIDSAGVEPSEALRWADIALYRSKEQGRMQATCFEPEMDEALRARRSLETDLRQALHDGTLNMVYQPQVDRWRQITAVEALLRWNHRERGPISPATFVPLAEESGIILALGEFVLREVFAQTRHWSAARVAINVSAVQLRLPGFAALVTRLLAQTGADPARYEIELTETALLGEDPATISNIAALKRIGFSIALDDFGTGYSSLGLLQRFSVDRIKIDRSFVSSLGDGTESQALIDAMVKLAKALDLEIIAEGVETEDQMERLVDCGCREFQGHLTGMPMPVDDIAALIGEVPDQRRKAAIGR